MSKKDNTETIPHPRENPDFIGNEAVCKQMEQDILSGKIPHAWLLYGPRGIGKATLAYRFARYLLAQGKTVALPAGQGSLFPEEKVEARLYVDPRHPAFMRVSAGSHADLLVLEDGKEGEEGNTTGNILIEEVRKATHFLRHTPSETPYRVVIIDSVDSMNGNAANAILKILEEPTANAVLILVSHALAKVSPTIRSRCRKIRMLPLAKEEVAKVLKKNYPALGDKEIKGLAGFASGAPGWVGELHDSNAIALYQEIVNVFATFPRLAGVEMLALAQKISDKKDARLWHVGTYLMLWFLIQAIRFQINRPLEIAIEKEQKAYEVFKAGYSVYALLECKEALERMIQETEALHLDKKIAVINAFLLMQKRYGVRGML